MISVAWMFWGVLFSSIGLGFFVYGRKQQAPIPFICGVLLMAYPYFVGNTILLVIIGLILIVIPYFIK